MSGVKGACGQKIQCQDPCKNPCQKIVCKDPCQDPCKPHHHHHHGTIYVHQQDPCNLCMPCNSCVVPCCPDPCNPCQGQGCFCCDK